MEFFRKAKSVRLRSHHDKFLLADDDKVTVCQDRHGTCKAAKWIVELVDGCDTVIRLKSCYGRYLTAADDQFLLGVTGRKVLQTLPSRLDSKVEWEPTRDGFQVRLKTRYGNYLRANGGLPPWRNSITHDIPHRHTGWILWQVDIVEVVPQSPAPKQRPPTPAAPPPPTLQAASKNDDDDDDDDEDDSSNVFRLRSDSLAPHSEVGGGGGGGRMIYYYVANEDGDIDERLEESSFVLKGHSLEQLTQELEKETGMEDVIVCSRNQSNGNLYPLRLALPPNNATMHIIVVPATSRVARDFVPDASSSSSS
ncbi:uncharacterized protein LOC124920611 [Impatiens glandulifera]|uniref:uncharacterized protein LOC124920611 n=1 Tax=Impatiens glandulifera TaxID=253017 RepID=UPI001FB188E1|nr:uncharacterized protein LOC124920611 [Impatiens glandulifera]